MQLSKDEWRRAAELSAAAEDGRKHAAWLRFKRFSAAPTAVLVAAGAVGLGAWWMFAHVVSPLFSGSGPSISGHLPLGFILVTLVAVVATVIAFRVSVPTGPFLIGRALAALFIWLGLLAYGVALIAS